MDQFFQKEQQDAMATCIVCYQLDIDLGSLFSTMPRSYYYKAEFCVYTWNVFQCISKVAFGRISFKLIYKKKNPSTKSMWPSINFRINNTEEPSNSVASTIDYPWEIRHRWFSSWFSHYCSFLSSLSLSQVLPMLASTAEPRKHLERNSFVSGTFEPRSRDISSYWRHPC